jgi:hypothetical protein
MKKTYILALLLLNCFELLAQQTPLPNSCNDFVKTTTPTINTWDWRVEDWEAYLPTNVGINTVRSPFFKENNPNTSNLVDFSPKDYDPSEGWELLQKTTGDPLNRISNPSWAFYNKNTAVMRVFFLVVEQTDLSTLNPNKGAFINVEFLTTSEPAYQSNVLTAAAMPLLPLDQFRNKTNLVGTNRFEAQAGFWLYADFPMVYDACTCLYKGRMFISVVGNESQSINMTINSLPASSPVSGGNTGGDLRSNFAKFGNIVAGGVKVFGDVTKSVEDLGKRWDSTGIPRPNIDLAEFEKVLKGVKQLASVIPGVSEVANKTFAAIDFFVGKSKKNAGNSTGVTITNNFQANGTINSTRSLSSFRLAIPGSNTQDFVGNVVPVYNNPLGIFNLLTTPEVKQKTFILPQFSTSIGTPIEACSGNFPTGAAIVTPIFHSYELVQNLEYVINPALSINYQLSDIQAAFVLEDTDYLGTATNMEYELNKVGGYKGLYGKDYPGNVRFKNLRSSYYPIGCLKESKPYLRTYTLQSREVPQFVCNPSEPTVYIKIIARLVKNNSGDPRDEILFVAKYPVKLIRENAQNANIPPSLENIPEVLTIPDGQVYNQTTTIQALNLVSIGRVTLNNGARLIVRAGQIQVRETATINTQYDLQTVSLYPSNCNIKQPPATAARIDQFCRSNLYTNPARFAVSREIRDIEEIRKEEEAINLSASPNPTKSDVTISYVLEQDAKVLVYVSNIMGERVYTLTDKEQAKGLQEVTFSTYALPAGIYLYTLETEHHKITKRLVVVK